MAKLPENFPFGESENITNEDLIRYIQEMYTQLAVAINSKPDVYQRNTNGLTSDVTLANGSININNSTNAVEVLTNHSSPTTVIWTAV